MAENINLAGMLVPGRQLRRAGLFNNILNDIGISETAELPVPDGTTQLTLADYASYLITKEQLQKGQQHSIMKSRLEFAHLVEDDGYLQHLIETMVSNWSTGNYQQLLETLHDQLLVDVCLNFPFMLLPARLQRDHLFASSWVERNNGKKFTLDGDTYTHRHALFSKTGKICHLTIKQMNANRELIMYWHINGAIKQSQQYEDGRASGTLEEFYTNGTKASLGTLKGGDYVGDSWTWHPTGQPMSHTVRDNKIIRSYTEWTDSGSVKSHDEYDTSGQLLR